MTADDAVREYARMVYGEALRLWKRGIGKRVGSIDDCVQVGYIGLINAVDKFDPTRGVKFSTYAHHAIYRAIRTAALNGGMVRVPQSTQAALWQAPANTLIQNQARQAMATTNTDPDILRKAPDRDHPPDVDHEEFAVVMRTMSHHLTPQTCRWITDFVMHRKPQHAIASEEGYTRQAVQQRIQYGLRILRRVLSGEPGKVRENQP